MTDRIDAEIHNPPRVQLDTRQRLTLRVPYAELTPLVATDMRIVLDVAEDVNGRLLDWPDAWELVEVKPSNVPQPHLALVYELTESHPLGADL